MSEPRIRVLSAGAVEPGLVSAAGAYSRQQEAQVEIDWATTPNIRRRIGAGEVFDLVLLTAEAASDLIASGHLRREPAVRVGSVGVGVAVRANAPVPTIGSAAEVRDALFDADSVIFTRATSGAYVESLLKREGLYERLLPRIARFETGPQMMDHLIHGSGKVLCLGAAVELRMFHGRGIRWVGPLPEPLQHRTDYVIARMIAAPNAEGAAGFARYLGGEAARRMLAECGVEMPVGCLSSPHRTRTFAVDRYPMSS